MKQNKHFFFNTKYHYKLILALVSMFYISNVFGQISDTSVVFDTAIFSPPPVEAKVDTSAENIAFPKVEDSIRAAIVSIPKDTILAIKNEKGFEYMSYIDSALRNLKLSKTQQQQHSSKLRRGDDSDSSQSVGSSFNTGIPTFLLWGIAIAVVGFVLYKLFIGNGSAFASNTRSNIPTVQLDEELNEHDLEGHLKKALREENYRLATRYLFLITLQQLGDKKAIALGSEKTNFQYSRELKDKQYYNLFSRVSFIYEYVWFGKFEINKEQYQIFYNDQQKLIKEI